MKTRGHSLAFGKRRERGLAAVEFAIILPVVLLIMLATAEFGRAYYQYNTLVKSVRNGVRYLANEAIAGTTGVIDLDTDKVDKVKNLVVFGNIAGSGTPLIQTLATDQVTVSSPDPLHVEVQADFPYQPLFAVLPGLTGGADTPMTFTLSASTSMRAL